MEKTFFFSRYLSYDKTGLATYFVYLNSVQYLCSSNTFAAVCCMLHVCTCKIPSLKMYTLLCRQLYMMHFWKINKYLVVNIRVVVVDLTPWWFFLQQISDIVISQHEIFFFKWGTLIMYFCVLQLSSQRIATVQTPTVQQPWPSTTIPYKLCLKEKIQTSRMSLIS